MALSLEHSVAVVPSSGALDVLTLNAAASCAWSVASSVPWLVLSPTAGVGPAVVSLRVLQQGGGRGNGPNDLTVTTVRRSLRLSWTLPAGVPVFDHIVEVGSQSGLSDLGSLRTASAAAAFGAENVPVGIYYLQVRAVTAAGTSDPSHEVVAVISDAVAGTPAPPTDLTPLAVDPARIGVRWSRPASGEVTLYIVEFGSQPGLSDLARVVAGTTDFSWDRALEPVHDYYVRVRAANSAGESGPSNELTISRGAGAAQAPGRPQALSTRYENGMLRIDWAAPADGRPITGYVIEVGTLPGAANLLVTTTAATSMAQPAPFGARYYLRVRGYNTVGAGPASDEVVVTTGTPASELPGTPGNVTAIVQDGRLSLQWTTPLSGGGVTDYVVEAGSSPGASDVGVIGTGNAQTVWTYDGIPADRTFYVRLRARNAVGVGPASPDVRIGPPQN